MELGDKPWFKKFLWVADASLGGPETRATLNFEQRNMLQRMVDKKGNIKLFSLTHS